jgi:DNA (cytosine-5-)-methyltransferase
VGYDESRYAIVMKCEEVRWVPSVHAIDLFCGTGGLSLGLKQAGINIVAGIDVERRCEYPYTSNLDAQFIRASVTDIRPDLLNGLWPSDGLRLLAGCAPCQPFSSQRRGKKPAEDKNWNLLSYFGRLVSETKPDYVTMENVPRLQADTMFDDFLSTLEDCEYNVVYGVLYGPDFGLPQKRRRLVLIASKNRMPSMPKPRYAPEEYRTVDEAIGDLPPLESGEHDRNDALHFARSLSPMNLRRARHSKPGGTWRDWPSELMLPCQRRDTNTSFGSFYGRMRGDEPSPTITTQPYNTGAGRFTHPRQDRGLTLREAAILQGFPRDFIFTGPDEEITLSGVGKLIGNAVPPAFGKAVGEVMLEMENGLR